VGSSALDGESGQIVVRLLRRAATEHGAAVICVTHDPRLEAFADRLVRIEDGSILSDEPTQRAKLAPTPELVAP
jgi:putative ABC transport system ATP-binding protein